MKPESFSELADIVGAIRRQNREVRVKVAETIADGPDWTDSLTNAAELILLSHAGRRDDMDFGMHMCSLEMHIKQVAAGKGYVLERMRGWIKRALEQANQ